MHHSYVSLQYPIDGLFIFAAICVGQAAGIGYIGIAMIMAMFFCFANAVLWLMDYGRNPLDDAQAARDRKKLEKSSSWCFPAIEYTPLVPFVSSTKLN
jgi:hypothetical protein